MLKCLILEDEPLAADVLQDYIHQMPFLKLAGAAISAMQAMDFLRNESVDLLFLDIHLPGLKGLDFLRTLKYPPSVIVVTAYHEYALQGYELNVVDYLLKPVEFKRFVEAVNKVNKPINDDPVRKNITLHSDKKTIIIPVEEIVYIESQKEYIKVQTIHGSHLSKYTLTKIAEELDPGLFLRVHRSFIVSLSKIKAYNQSEIDLPGQTIPVGGNYREQVNEKLKALFP
jgi:DNA-binding LytR/AlgR family response regulator